MTAEIRSINCPACGAGQTVHGGGRVQTHVCPYCGSALDALDDFAILARYENRLRPDTPLNLGDRGTLWGVEFTIIGIAGWVERYDGRSWRWTDHQVFSPTHGYGWITREDTGHWTVTRKLRKFPKQWLSPTSVETAESRPHLWIDGQRLAYYETSTARIEYLEGAFNWAPKVGDTVETVTLVGDGRMITLSGFSGASEREVEDTRMMSPEDCASFGLTPAPRGRHPLAVGPRWRHHGFVITCAAAFIALTGVVGVVQGGSGGRNLADAGRLKLGELPHEITFDVPEGTRLAKLQLYTDLNDGWAWFDVEIENEDGDVVLGGGRELSYYSGVDNEGAWSEGSRRGTVTFPVSGPDRYTMTIEMPEYGSGNTGDRQTNSFVSAKITGLSYSWRPLGATGVVFALILLATFGWDSLRKARMLAGSDWTDED
ncbi:MAG: hypothetical protein CML68_05975 [Rhodobacteraceae bacterium]|nr:hypothetical protein [Paracoccaceae bacterium]